MHIAQIDQVEHPAAIADHLAGLGDAVLDAAVGGSAEHGVVDVRLQPFDGRCHGLDARIGLEQFGAGGGDGRLGRRHLGLGSADGRLVAEEGGAVVIQILRRGGALAGEHLVAVQPLARRLQLGLALCHHRGRGLPFALPLHHPAAAGCHGDARLLELGPGLAQPGLQLLRVQAGEFLAGGDKITLVHQDLADTAALPGGDIDLHRLDAAVAPGQPCGQAGRPQVLPGQPGDHGQHSQADQPGRTPQPYTGRGLHSAPRSAQERPANSRTNQSRNMHQRHSLPAGER